MFFLTSRDIEVLLIFSLLASVLAGMSHFLMETVMVQETYVFYQTDFFFSLIKYILLAGYAFYIALRWRELKWLKDSLIFMLVILISLLCSMQMKIITDNGIIFSNMIRKEEIRFEDVSAVHIKYEGSSFASRISYTIFSEDNKYKYFDPFNIHNGDQVTFLEYKIHQYNPTYEIEDIHRLEFKTLLDYEKDLINIK